MKLIFLSKMIFKNIIRQRTIIFSSLILPLVIIWATWWVTAEVPMIFNLYSGLSVTASMLDVHIITGALTAMGITSAIFGFLITAELDSISKRLKQMGYSVFQINLSIFIIVIIVLTMTAFIAVTFSLYLSENENYFGIIVATLLISIIYASLGNLLANIYPDITSGTLILLIFAFLDLMLITNPMGENIYLQDFTYYFPGFWPTQIVLEYGFIDNPGSIQKPVVLSIIYSIIILISSFLVKRFGLSIEVMK